MADARVPRAGAHRPAAWCALVTILTSAVACADATAPEDVLSAPEDLGDGWSVASPASAGLDPAVLAPLVERVAREEFGHVHALLVVRGGALVLERYFHEYDGSEPHTLQSVTKSVTSALIGIALDRGDIPDLDRTLGEIFPDYPDVFDAAPSKSDIRLRDLLSMQSGLSWDESTYPYADDRNDVGRMNRSPDWIRVALEQPVAWPPGTAWEYSSGSSILLSGALLRLTGRDAVEYATEHLFEPMGFGDFVWYRNPVDGLPHTGGGLRLLPRDLARFGQLYLDRGVWNGARLLSEEWVTASRTLRASVDRFGYGYQWWMRPLSGVAGHAPARTDVLFGWGYGGQHVFVSDDLDMVVVVNAWNEDGSSRGQELFDAVVRAVR